MRSIALLLVVLASECCGQTIEARFFNDLDVDATLFVTAETQAANTETVTVDIPAKQPRSVLLTSADPFTLTLIPSDDGTPFTEQGFPVRQMASVNRTIVLNGIIEKRLAWDTRQHDLLGQSPIPYSINVRSAIFYEFTKRVRVPYTSRGRTFYRDQLVRDRAYATPDTKPILSWNNGSPMLVFPAPAPFAPGGRVRTR